VNADMNPGASDILLIDDDAGFLLVLSRILERYPSQRFATSSQVGLRLALDRAPDLILLDVEMPGMGGLEFCRQLKSHARLSDIPVIFVTSHGEITVAADVFRNGGSDFVTKPVDQDKLLASVEQFLTRRPSSPVDRLNIGMWPSIEGIDSAIIRDQIGDDARLFMILLHKLVDDFSDVAAMSETIGSATIDGFLTRMHRLKGAAGTLGASHLFELASMAEASGRSLDMVEFGRRADAAAVELELLRARIETAGAGRSPAPPVTPMGRLGSEAFDTPALIRALRQQSLSSLGMFDEFEGDVEVQLGKDVADRARDHLTHLRFDCAADLLQAAALSPVRKVAAANGAR
jgi:CheY-like chemotaxis protein/HPt (histidine-containing phosphotransfer) domain-containing protein